MSEDIEVIHINTENYRNEARESRRAFCKKIIVLVYNKFIEFINSKMAMLIYSFGIYTSIHALAGIYLLPRIIYWLLGKNLDQAADAHWSMKLAGFLLGYIVNIFNGLVMMYSPAEQKSILSAVIKAFLVLLSTLAMGIDSIFDIVPEISMSLLLVLAVIICCFVLLGEYRYYAPQLKSLRELFNMIGNYSWRQGKIHRVLFFIYMNGMATLAAGYVAYWSSEALIRQLLMGFHVTNEQIIRTVPLVIGSTLGLSSALLDFMKEAVLGIQCRDEKHYSEDVKRYNDISIGLRMLVGTCGVYYLLPFILALAESLPDTLWWKVSITLFTLVFFAVPVIDTYSVATAPDVHQILNRRTERRVMSSNYGSIQEAEDSGQNQLTPAPYSC